MHDLDKKYLPREKAINRGIDSLKDSELIAILISTGIKGQHVIELSESLISIIRKHIQEEDGRLLNIETLLRVKGIGRVKALKIMSAIELGRRLFGGQSDKLMISNTQKAYEVFKYLELKRQEHLLVLYLNSRYELQKRKTVYIGNSNKLYVQPRDIVSQAIELNSTFIIMAHNHPSGNFQPSDEDVAVTKRVKAACEILGIEFLEHLVIGKEGFSVVEC